ncbi:MAG: hypothetical protein NTW14_07020 [bacterium]|nr:hypothetical protein [bacterium]
MSIQLNPEQIAKIVQARQDAQLTQLELSELAKISLRTIKDLDAGRRTIFYESTIISLCRSLKISYAGLTGRKESYHARFKPQWKLLFISGLTIVIIFLAFSLSQLSTGVAEKPVVRRDWILPEHKLPVYEFNPLTADPEIDWRQLNYYIANPPCIERKGKVSIELKWSYHCGPKSNPRYYISAFTEWDPDREIQLLRQDLKGDSSLVFNFNVIGPKVTGIHHIRVFFASSWGPIPSYYGHEPPSQLKSPASDFYTDIPIEVVDKK